ncbi:hypothetical protein B0I63_003534 [Clostridium beijerinckii]|uniref:Uncharacterized protein n=1 Tax=Clostridium beijerinckii TaxID=1520 RepID=A0A9Q5CKK4_CLOBE|nr:hypothetical protein [Clostridium beijerinckii]MBA2902599.1 hypothetical protein [Clostridium beijerinckii]MBA2912425.1 hypothetical protein [Clostridium beijerinckii]MBA9014493.1 hypothetical protein [Clostridium beijerinckii]NRT03082.1 hypothetical protein [Clostridium beijerinckii]
MKDSIFFRTVVTEIVTVTIVVVLMQDIQA